jgi:hypothetical protein
MIVLEYDKQYTMPNDQQRCIKGVCIGRSQESRVECRVRQSTIPVKVSPTYSFSFSSRDAS